MIYPMNPDIAVDARLLRSKSKTLCGHEIDILDGAIRDPDLTREHKVKAILQVHADELAEAKAKLKPREIIARFRYAASLPNPAPWTAEQNQAKPEPKPDEL